MTRKVGQRLGAGLATVARRILQRCLNGLHQFAVALVYHVRQFIEGFGARESVVDIVHDFIGEIECSFRWPFHGACSDAELG